MRCEDAEALLPLVADGIIDPDDDAALFAHLAACPDCQRSLSRHDLLSVALAADAHPMPRRRRWPLPLAAAATAVLGLGAGLLWMRQEPEPTITVIEQVLHGAGRGTVYRIQHGPEVIDIDLDLIDGAPRPRSHQPHRDGTMTVGAPP